ncbi:MAG: penicillin-binding protein 2 [Paludibacteraceae bacterium]|nr:penicillin-binding protein 2 [Paludibacteraceae bacterium]
MADNLKYTIIRFAFIFLLITLGFVVVMIKIAYTQHAPEEKEKWEKIADNQIINNRPIMPTRGNIMDCNGCLLASSLPQYTVYMDTRVEALHLGGDTLFYKYIDSIASGLSRIVGDRTPQEYRQRMVSAFRSKSSKIRDKDIRLCKGRVSYVQKREIQQLPLISRGLYKSGVHFEEQHIRKKPFGRLGSRTIGSIYGEGGNGNAGLEKSLESFLHGKEGISTYKRVAGHKENVPVKEAENGCDIITTLDVNLMDICESVLEEKLQTAQAEWGCVILMETHTGQIKAICNLDRQKDGSYYEVMNHAVVRVEPGSTFKTIAMMAALDDGRININDTFYVYRSGWDYQSLHHTDSHPRDTFYTARSALAISSNIALAKMITKSYDGKADKFIKKLNKMGISKNFSTEIPGSTPPLIEIPDNDATLSKMAYGYSVELSPLQIITFYNAIANNGKMIRPYIVSQIEKEGTVQKEYGTETLNSSICKSSTLRDIRNALHDVVWDNDLPGTASVLKWDGHIIRRKAQSDLVHIAGKTGTAQLLRPGENGKWRYHNDMHRMTFVGYFPEENPQYTCLCMIEHPIKSELNNWSYDAGADCGSAVRQIAERTMAYGWVYEIKDGQTIFTKR